MLPMYCGAMVNPYLHMKPILGIETSCDETAAAVLGGDGTVLAERVLSQTREHAAFGGVVPEIAARAHLRYLPDIVQATMAQAGVEFADLGGVAATSGPGLIGGLIVGCQFGKGIAMAHELPFLAINHLEAHALTARLPGLSATDVTFPYLLMLLSGGHSLCVAVTALGAYQRLGGTIDDAAGEAFDKVAKLLGLGWPGGPALETLAMSGDPHAYVLPRPMLRRPGCDFSFSGLKTAVAQLVQQQASKGATAQMFADIAASFQRAMADVLADRTEHACTLMRQRFANADLMVIAGGVAANRTVREAVTEAAARQGFRLFAPPLGLCSDNAVMVAWAGLERLRANGRDSLDFRPVPRWPLESMRQPAP